MRLVVVLVIVSGAAGLAAAQPAPPGDPVPVETPAQAMFTEGRNLLEAGQPGPACARFEASLKLDPEASGTILNLGLCNEDQDRLATALTWFRRIEARASELANQDTEVAAKAKMVALAAKVPTIKIAFTHPAPAGTVVKIDGAVVREIDYARIELDAGKHAVDIAVPDAPATHQDVVLVDGVVKIITVPIAGPVAAVPLPTTVGDRGAAQRRRAYILGGVGGAVMIGDLVFCIAAKLHHDATDMLDTRDQWRDAVRYGGTAVFLASGTAIAGGVWLYLHAPKGVEVAPAVGPEHVGVSISGRF